MLLTEQHNLTEEITDLSLIYGKDRSALLPILQELEKRYNHIPDYAQQEIAKVLSLHPVEVHSVISFYSFLNRKPQGKNMIRICRTVSCDMAGKDTMIKAVERELQIKVGQTTPDRKFTLDYTNCLGMCDQGPAMLVNDKVFTKLTAEKAVAILEEIMEK